MALSSAIGPAAFELYSYHACGLWLPFSVIMKASGSAPHSFGERVVSIGKGSGFREMVVSVSLLWLLRYRTRGFWDPSQLLLFLSAAVTALHIVFAPVGWLMRYDSYFMALCLFSLSVAVAISIPRLRLVPALRALTTSERIITVLLFLACFSLLPHLILRATHHDIVTPVRASVDRYNEHIQIARFVAHDYDHSTIALNDIGAVAFYSQAQIIDLVGLGSVEPAYAVHNRLPFTAADIARWTSSRHASIAIIQSGWTIAAAITPPNWIRVATWHIPRNVLNGDLEINFFAIDPTQVPELCHHLEIYPLSSADHRILTPGVCGIGSAPSKEVTLLSP